MNNKEYLYELIAVVIIALSIIFTFAFLAYQLINFCFAI